MRSRGLGVPRRRCVIVGMQLSGLGRRSGVLVCVKATSIVAASSSYLSHVWPSRPALLRVSRRDESPWPGGRCYAVTRNPSATLSRDTTLSRGPCSRSSLVVALLSQGRITRLQRVHEASHGAASVRRGVSGTAFGNVGIIGTDIPAACSRKFAGRCKILLKVG